MICPTLNINSNNEISILIIDVYPKLHNTIKISTPNCAELFFLLLQAFLCQYNEGYVDGYEDGVDDILEDE